MLRFHTKNSEDPWRHSQTPLWPGLTRPSLAIPICERSDTSHQPRMGMAGSSPAMTGLAAQLAFTVVDCSMNLNVLRLKDGLRRFVM